jgi:hypothetical protein
VGYVVNDKPQYAVYDTSYVSTNGMEAGKTVTIVDGNYAFDAKTGTASLDATPGANGYAQITSAEQAKAWFSSQSAVTGLQILKSFYYE